MTTPEPHIPGTLEQVVQNRNEKLQQVTGGANEPAEQLPTGNQTALQAEQAQTTQAQPPNQEAVAAPAEAAPATDPASPAEIPKTKIRIGTEEFDSSEEAFKYAEGLQNDKLISDSYTQGIQDSVAQQNAEQTAVPAEPVDDNFDEQFYTNPREVIKNVREQATADALQVIRQENAMEKQWNIFFDENPKLHGQREVAQMVLNQNMSTIGRMTDMPKARKLLAIKTMEVFNSYGDHNTPRTDLPNNGAGSSPSQATAAGVTQPTGEKKKLSFFDQIRSLNKGT